MAILTITHNSVWIIVNGGYSQYRKREGSFVPVDDDNMTVLLQLGMIHTILIYLTYMYVNIDPQMHVASSSEYLFPFQTIECFHCG